MKAMVYTGPMTLEVLDVREPVAAQGEVLVRVARVGICGSELEGVKSRSPFRVPPLVMGHEFSGERADTGERVIVNPIVSCGSCDLCLRGAGNVCRTRAVVGIHRPGGFAELAAVPERNLHPMPAGLTFEQGALVEPLANAVHAWRLATRWDPVRVGIIGAGTIGLVALAVALHKGALEVHVADLAQERLEVARTMGATSVGPALEGEFDVMIDAVGAPPTRNASVALLRPGGAAVWLGLHAEDPSFDALGLIRGEKAVVGSFAYTDQDFRQAVGLIGRLDLPWITTFPLDEGVSIFEGLMAGRTDLVKAQLRP